MRLGRGGTVARIAYEIIIHSSAHPITHRESYSDVRRPHKASISESNRGLAVRPAVAFYLFSGVPLPEGEIFYE